VGDRVRPEALGHGAEVEPGAVQARAELPCRRRIVQEAHRVVAAPQARRPIRPGTRRSTRRPAWRARRTGCARRGGSRSGRRCRPRRARPTRRRPVRGPPGRQFEDHPAGQDVLEVDRDGGVHAGIVRLVVIEQPGQRRLGVGERGSHIDPLGRRRRRGGTVKVPTRYPPPAGGKNMCDGGAIPSCGATRLVGGHNCRSRNATRAAVSRWCMTDRTTCRS
jgi:hypothetical protein